MIGPGFLIGGPALLLPFKKPGALSKQEILSLSVMDAGCHTFSAGVRPASIGQGPSFAGLRPSFKLTAYRQST